MGTNSGSARFSGYALVCIESTHCVFFAQSLSFGTPPAPWSNIRESAAVTLGQRGEFGRSTGHSPSGFLLHQGADGFTHIAMIQGPERDLDMESPLPLRPLGMEEMNHPGFPGGILA